MECLRLTIQPSIYNRQMAKPAKINFIVLNQIMLPVIEKACGQRATQIATERFESSKAAFLDAFITHDVSREIDSGAELGTSEIISTGNLFGFIGFDEGSKPVQKLYDYLKENIRMVPQG